MYLTRNQAGVYSASGVRIPPFPPDSQRPRFFRGFLLFGDGGVGGALRDTRLHAFPHCLVRHGAGFAVRAVASQQVGLTVINAFPFRQIPQASRRGVSRFRGEASAAIPRAGL